MHQMVKHTAGPFSKAGDSGSLVFKDDGSNEAIGITNAGNGIKSYVLPLKTCFDAIRDQLGVNLSLCTKWQQCRIQPDKNELQEFDVYKCG